MVESQRQASQASGSGNLAQSTFVGRQREMEELKSALGEALSGQGRLVMLAGEPGIGKTRTARELAAYATLNGAEALWGRCYAEQGAPPYWPWVQVIRSYIRDHSADELRSQMGTGAADIAEVVSEVKEWFPDLPPPPALEPQQARFRLFDSITTFLKNAAQSQPLLLALDDLHWADQPSLLLLQFLARQIEGSRLLVAGCYRDVELSRQHPLSETLAQLSREPAFQRKTLRGLSQEDTRRFIESAAGIPPSSGLVEAIYAHTEGNPFFVAEVIRFLAEDGGLAWAETGGQRGIRIPEGVREVIGQRLNRLSDLCNQTLTMASIIGREFDFKLLRILSSEAAEGQLLRALDEALKAHLLEELPGPGERYQFTHALVQQALAEELSASHRVRLHARIGEALEGLYETEAAAHAGELARHFAEAVSIAGSAKLAHYSLLAGEQALATYAHEEALAHFQRGLAAREGQPMDAEKAALLFGLGRAQVATLQMHQSREAVASLGRAFDYYAGAGDVDRAVAVAEYPLGTSSGMLPGAAELIARALALVSPGSLGAGRLLVRHGWDLGRMKGDYQSAQEAFGQARAIALHQGDADLEMQTASAAAEVDLFHLRCQESLEKTLRAIELARQADDPRVLAQSHQRATLSLTILGDLEGARLHAEAGLAPAEKLRDRFWLDSALWSKQFLYRLEGNWRAAREISERGLAMAPMGTRILADRVLLEYELGDFSQGGAYLKRLVEAHVRASSRQPTTGYALPAVVLPLVARIDRTVEGLDIAQATAETILSALFASPLVITMARAGLALLAVLRGDALAAQEQYTALESQRGTMLQTGAAAIDRVLGLLAQTMSQLDAAAAHFEDALVFCRKAGARSELAWSLYDYANLLQEMGQNEKALALLDEALSISTDLGMKPLVEKAQVLKVQAEAQQGKAPAYPANLTRRQVEVLRFIAEGKTNREIAQDLVLSERTVQRHVADIYVKIGARNRSEATAFVLSGLYPIK